MFRIITALLIIATPSITQGAWHTGILTGLGIGYGGAITFHISGLSKTGCTCDPSWTTWLCLDNSRSSFSEEYAFLLKTHAAGSSINVNINETTCYVIAMYEN